MRPEKPGLAVSVVATTAPMFDANGPDVALNMGAVVATTDTASPGFSGRTRYKFGADALYKFLPYMAVGGRVDHVVPSSKDSSETFNVVAARLVFRTDWQSREQIMLLYAKWFYGTNTHPEYSSLTSSLPLPRLDDQLIALNVNIYW